MFVFQSTTWCFFVFVKMSVCMFYMSGIKYRPSTSDTAENVEINQISRDKWAALTGYPGKLLFSPFFGFFSENYFLKGKSPFPGKNIGIILAGAVASSLLGFSANGMKGWNVVNILGELVCIRCILHKLKIKICDKENLTLPKNLMFFVAQRWIVKITQKYFWSEFGQNV